MKTVLILLEENLKGRYIREEMKGKNRVIGKNMNYSILTKAFA